MQDSCEAAGDAVLDLVDYCHRKLTLLVGKATGATATTHDQHSPKGTAVVSSTDVMTELQMQCAAREFEISLKAVSVLRFITDHTERYRSTNKAWGSEDHS